MAFSLDEIRGDLNRGVAFNSHYEVDIGDSGVKFRAISVTAPGRSIASSASGAYGAIQEIGYSTIFTPINMTIVVSPNHSERLFFSSWQDRIVGGHRNRSGAARDSDFNVGYYNDYIRTVRIFQYNDKGEKERTITLNEAYPQTVGELNYSYTSKELLTFNATIRYRYFTEL